MLNINCIILAIARRIGDPFFGHITDYHGFKDFLGSLVQKHFLSRVQTHEMPIKKRIQRTIGSSPANWLVINVNLRYIDAID